MNEPTPMHKVLMNFISLMLAAVLVGCERVEESRSTVHEARLGSLADADVAWSKLTSTSQEAPWKLYSEGTFANYLREMETERQRFRRDGLAFWHTFPDDPRRFEWLVLTTILDPAYPMDIEDWIEREYLPLANGYQQNEQARSSWAQEYAELKNEFMSHPDVSSQAKRTLYIAEHSNWIEQQRRLHARTGVPAASGDAIRRVEEYASMFAAPLSEDRDRTNGSLHHLNWQYGFLISRSDIHDMDVRQFMRELGVSLQKYEHSALSGTTLATDTGIQARRFAKANGRFPETHFLWEQGERFATYYADKSILRRDDWPEITDQNLGLVAMLNELYQFGSVFQPQNYLDRVYFHVHSHYARLKYRELGLRHWDGFSAEERVQWATYLTGFSAMPEYPDGYLDNVFKKGNWREANYREVAVDEQRTLEVDRRMHLRLDDLHSSHDVSSVIRARSKAAKIFSIFGRSIHAGISAESKQILRESLVEELNDYSGLYAEDKLFEEVVATIVSTFASNQARFDVSDDYLKVLTSHLLESPVTTLRRIAEAIHTRKPLEIGDIVDLEIRDLNGVWKSSAQTFAEKIVLVDHWDTNCAPCIAAFPGIHRIYEDYKEQGFEVLSIAYDAESRGREVLNIKKRLGLTWETYNGEGLWPLMGAKYGFSSFPQYMLINRQGELIATTESLRSPDLIRERVESFLAAEGYLDDAAPGLWRLGDEDTTVHILGTLHMLKPGSFWRSDEIDAVIDSADILYRELDLSTSSEVSEAVTRKLAIASEGESTFDVLSENEANRVRVIAAKLGVTEESIASRRPWATMMLLGRAYGINRGATASGVDAALSQELESNGAEIRGFASLLEQTQSLSNIPIDVQGELLLEFLSALEEDSGYYDRLLAAYLKGDDSGVEATEVAQLKRHPAAYQSLILNRNERWASEIARVINEDEGDILVAVGVSHLVGPDSLQSMLTDKGYSVVRVH